MDTLVEIYQDKWIDIYDLYRQNLPQGIVGLSMIDMQQSHPKLRDFLQFNAYCPFGQMENGFVFVTKSCLCYSICIQPITSIDKIEEALTKTSVIDWERTINIQSAGRDVMDCLERLQRPLNMKICRHETPGAIVYFLDKDTTKFDTSSCPPDTFVDSLKPEHIKLVDETWTFHSERSKHFFQALMHCGLTWVLYSSADQKPLAWVTVDDTGAFTHLYCLEDHRRKGYAEYILKVAINDLLGQGKHVLSYTLEHNKKPQGLMKKLGFKVVGTNFWTSLAKI